MTLLLPDLNVWLALSVADHPHNREAWNWKNRLSGNDFLVFATKPFAEKTASKWVGDCWLLAFAQAAGARLITFDQALLKFALEQGQDAIMP